ncbi:MAG: hypothetical protein HC806_09040 [Anaerolineae bacterium]|nr:hypothetical protein [Anaerolineae bacterium]
MQSVSVGQVIAGGGVFDPGQAQALKDAGAFAIQLDLRLWREPWPDQAWKEWLGKDRTN